DRAGRGNAADAGAHRHPAARQRAGRSGGQPGPCQRRGPAADGQPDRASTPAVAAQRPRGELLQEVAQLVSRGVLRGGEAGRGAGRTGRKTTAVAVGKPDNQSKEPGSTTTRKPDGNTERGG